MRWARPGRGRAGAAAGAGGGGVAKGPWAEPGSPSSVTVSDAAGGSAAAQRGPGRDPIVLVLAGRRFVLVGAARLGGAPVPDLVVVGLVGRVRQLAMTGRDGLGVVACLLAGGCFAEPDRGLAVGFG